MSVSYAYILEAVGIIRFSRKEKQCLKDRLEENRLTIHNDLMNVEIILVSFTLTYLFLE